MYKLIFLMLLVFSFGRWFFVNAAEIDDLSNCPMPVKLSDMLTDERLFFTMPTAGLENPSLELWYADKLGTHSTAFKSLADQDVLSINRTGDSILVLDMAGETNPAVQSWFNFMKGYIKNIFAINTVDFSITNLQLPKGIEQLHVQRQVYWIGDNKALLISIPEQQKFVELDLDTGHSQVMDWPTFPDIDLQPPGGYLLPSPNGKYFIYTVRDPLIGDASELAWKIANWKGEIVQDFVIIRDYILGIGNTAVWLPDSSGIIVKHIDFSQGTDNLTFRLFQIMLDGKTIQLNTDARWLNWGVIDRNGSHIAYVDQTELLSEEYRLKILDIENKDIEDYCGVYIQELGSWSFSNQLIAYTTSGLDENVNIYVVNVDQKTIASVAPYPPINDTVGDEYIHVIGWSSISP